MVNEQENENREIVNRAKQNIFSFFLYCLRIIFIFLFGIILAAVCFSEQYTIAGWIILAATIVLMVLDARKTKKKYKPLKER